MVCSCFFALLNACFACWSVLPVVHMSAYVSVSCWVGKGGDTSSGILIAFCNASLVGFGALTLAKCAEPVVFWFVGSLCSRTDSIIVCARFRLVTFRSPM